MCAVMVLSLVACGGVSKDWHEQYALGVKYVKERNYEEAVSAFNKAIEIDPKMAEAYVELAKVYVVQGNNTEAQNVLYKASEIVEDTSKIDAVLAENGFDKIVTVESEQVEDGTERLDYYDEDGETEETPFEFDESLIVKSEREDRGDGSWFIIDYDENDNEIRITSYNDDGSVYSVIEYNGDGICRRKTFYYSDGSVESINEFNKKGYFIRKTFYDYDGSVICWYIYDYDENDNRIRETWYNADGSVENWLIDDYDENGNCIRRTEYNGDGSADRMSEYDENGKEIRETWYNADGSVGGWSIINYDEYGFYSSTTYYNADGSIASDN